MSGRGETIRAFFAIDLSDSARRVAADTIDALRRAAPDAEVRWIRPEALHVTLRFLGSIPADSVPTLCARVSPQVAAEPRFTLALGAVRAFPSPRRPRAVAIEVAPEAPLAALAAAVERGVVAAGLPPETRAFRPHLTLGRVKERAAPVTASVTALSESIPVEEAVLFRSELRPTGAVYTSLARLPLGGEGVAAGAT